MKQIGNLRRMVAVLLSLVLMTGAVFVPASAASVKGMIKSAENQAKHNAGVAIKKTYNEMTIKQVPAHGYFSGKLTTTGQTTYNLLVDAAKNFRTEVRIPTISSEEKQNVLNAIYWEHPELFYFTDKNLTYVTHETESTATITYPNLAETKQKVSQFNSAVNNFLAGAPKNGTALQKELYVHDKLVRDTTYKLNTGTAYNSLVEHVGNCNAYSYAFSYLLNQLGVPTRVIRGTTNTSRDAKHMWNVVTLDGTEYMVDVTWDDPTNMNGSKFISHRYFNVSKNMLTGNHTPYDAKDWVSCNSDSLGYYRQNGLFFANYDAAKAALPSILAKSASDGMEYVEIQLASPAAVPTAYASLVDNGEIFPILAAANQTAAKKLNERTAGGDRNSTDCGVLRLTLFYA